MLAKTFSSDLAYYIYNYIYISIYKNFMVHGFRAQPRQRSFSARSQAPG
jgi:hypothetical protein